MAFQIPSQRDLWSRIRDSMRTFLPGTDALIEPNNLSVVGRVFALIMGSGYERMAYLYRQLFASTADGFHLEYRHAFEFGLTRKQPAAAQGRVSFTQVLPATTIPSGYPMTRTDGVSFRLIEDAVPDGFGVCVAMSRADVQGALTNTPPGVQLAFSPDSAYPSLPPYAIVGELGLGGGADSESDEELRARVVQRKQNQPQGGSRSDYERWALGVPGVTRVFVSAFRAASEVDLSRPLTIFPLFDGTRANGIPTPYDLFGVAEYLDSVRPVAASVYVAAARAQSVNISIRGLQIDSPTLRASIRSNLAAMFFERIPVVTADNQFTLPQAWIDEAISRSTGYRRHRLVIPDGDISFDYGVLPVLGTIDFGA